MWQDAVKGEMMISHPSSKVGSIVALGGGVLALIAFFALPLYSISFFLPLSLSASQLASFPLPAEYDGLTGIVGWPLWLAALLPLLVCGGALFALFGSVPVAVPSTGHPPGGTVYYGPVAPPNFNEGGTRGVRVSSSLHNAVLGMLVSSGLALLLCMMYYLRVSQPLVFYRIIRIDVTLVPFLSSGFWVYIVGMLIALLGALIQLRRS